MKDQCRQIKTGAARILEEDLGRGGGGGGEAGSFKGIISNSMGGSRIPEKRKYKWETGTPSSVWAQGRGLF